MTPTEARAWLSATKRGQHSWSLDSIHCTIEDAIIYRGVVNGYYVNVVNGYYVNVRRVGNGFGVEIGTYEGALTHIGDAAFNPIGKKFFTLADEAMNFLRDSIGIPQYICQALLKGYPLCDTCGGAAMGGHECPNPAGSNDYV